MAQTHSHDPDGPPRFSSSSATPKIHTKSGAKRAAILQNLFFGLAEGFCVMTGGCAVGTFSGGMLNPAVAVGVWMLNVAEIHSIQDGLFFFFPGGPAEDETSDEDYQLWTHRCGPAVVLLCYAAQSTLRIKRLLAAVVFRITHPSEYCKVLRCWSAEGNLNHSTDEGPALAERPSSSTEADTESALRFAANCRKVFTHPMRNEEPKNETAFALQRELEQLARELANVQNKEVRRELSERLTTAQLLSEQHGSWEEQEARSKELEMERRQLLNSLNLLGTGGLAKAASTQSLTQRNTARGTQTSKKFPAGGLERRESAALRETRESLKGLLAHFL
ncbi:Zeaxanthin epoxidase [Durusdinium trenchii]|uniref:Chloroplastic n=1 Tax=Durusdinium trenchii TaxID=1381693 RepID=A0ABP0S8C7_9DINO